MDQISKGKLLKEKKKKSKKHQSERVYDPDGYRKRVDCVLFKNLDKTEVMLVSSRNHYGCWTIAGGGIEPNETPQETAVREAREEAGVISYVVGTLGSFDDNERMTRTEAFSMVVTDEVSEWLDRDECGRSRKWFSIPDAIQILIERQKHDKVKYFDGCIPGSNDLTLENNRFSLDTSLPSKKESTNFSCISTISSH